MASEALVRFLSPWGCDAVLLWHGRKLAPVGLFSAVGGLRRSVRDGERALRPLRLRREPADFNLGRIGPHRRRRTSDSARRGVQMSGRRKYRSNKDRFYD